MYHFHLVLNSAYLTLNMSPSLPLLSPNPLFPDSPTTGFVLRFLGSQPHTYPWTQELRAQEGRAGQSLSPVYDATADVSFFSATILVCTLSCHPWVTAVISVGSLPPSSLPNNSSCHPPADSFVQSTIFHRLLLHHIQILSTFSNAREYLG